MHQLAFNFTPDGLTVPPIRRRVLRTQMAPTKEGAYLFRARSFTRFRGRVHRLSVNPRTGRVWCSCPDFQYRKRLEHPTFFGGPMCKHLRRAIRTVRSAERQPFALSASKAA